ncbi:MAG: argininosuccinate lyase [Gaiellales bacterium]|nr:MAG: argininosuccinate lyase [Gaiellales bacterium]
MNDDGHFWSGRFEQPPHELFEQLNASITFDWRLAPYDIQGSVAHARMLSSIGVLTEEEFAAIEDGLHKVMSEIARGEFAFDLADEDIHSAVEKRLIALIGDTGKKLHTARSRNDQVATDLALYIQDQLRQHLADLAGLLEALLKQAQAGVEAIMPGYTHLQRAQPVLLAHHLLAYFEMFSRDYVRLWRALDAARVMPLGAGALAGVNYPVDREAVAAELGFERPGANSIDDVSSRDFALDYLAAAAGVSMHLSRLAAELILWSSSEFGFVEISDMFTSGSSIMPQKKNADACELIRAKAARVAADHQGLLSLMTALPLAYNKDAQEDKLYVFDAADVLLLTLPVMAEMVGTLSFDPGRMRAAAEESFTVATEVADYLVGRGESFRDAHRIVGQLVRKCIDEGRRLDELGLDELSGFSERFDEGYHEAVRLESAIERKASYGGTATASVRAQLKGAASRLEGMRQTLDELDG